MPRSRRNQVARLDPRGPLIFDTRTLDRSPGSEHSETRVVPAPAGLYAGLAGIAEGAEMVLEVRLESVAEGVLVTATATAPMSGECARCLDEVGTTVEVGCRELFEYERDAGPADDDRYSLDGDLLDFGPVLRDALVLALPLAPLCRDDCPGLCAECGAQLAQAGPDHRHGPQTDPRWAALQQRQENAGPGGSPGPDMSEES